MTTDRRRPPAPTSPRRVRSSPFSLSRRALLRGAGAAGLATMGLPLLEAMLNPHGEALAGGAALPTRFLVWFFGNGVKLNQFEPAAAGADWELTSELEPLSAVKDYLTVCTGMRNRCEEVITHHEGMTIFNGYTMVNIFQEPGISSRAGGPTIDQVIADRIAAGTSTASIQAGVSQRLSLDDGGTTMFAVSHRSANQPLLPEFNPQQVWQSLFGEFVPRPDDKALRLSVLESVKADAARLREQLGATDRQRLEAHLEGIRALEIKIQSLPPECVLPDLPEETNPDAPGPEPLIAVNEVMSDLLVQAFKCDVTRVASLFFLGGAARTHFTDLGQQDPHHVNTHDSSRQGEVHQGVIYIMQRFAYLLEKMKAEVDATGKNLLDTSIVYAGSDCAEGIDHGIARQPIILVGHGRDQLAYPGVHYSASPSGQPAQGNTSDVLLTVARCYDPTIASIGAGAPMSTTVLPSITGTAFEG